MEIWLRFKRKIVIVLVLCLVAGFGYVRKAVSSVSVTPLQSKTIIIDAGHPGLANTIDLVRKLP